MIKTRRFEGGEAFRATVYSYKCQTVFICRAKVSCATSHSIRATYMRFSIYMGLSTKPHCAGSSKTERGDLLLFGGVSGLHTARKFMYAFSHFFKFIAALIRVYFFTSKKFVSSAFETKSINITMEQFYTRLQSSKPKMNETLWIFFSPTVFKKKIMRSQFWIHIKWKIKKNINIFF